jgi:N-acetylglucosamine kinase-like BadF-type ATPase
MRNLFMLNSPLHTPAFIIGVDGGGTKTVALVATMKGKVVGRGESGPSNYHNIGSAAATRAIKESVRRAQVQAGLKGRRAELAVVALAAIDSDRDIENAEHFVRRARIARRAIVVHDSKAALYAATRGRQGIVVIAGTGCVAAGVNRAGEYRRVSGWGYAIDDEGSSYDIGRKALTSAFRAIDRRGPKTKLVELLTKKFGVMKLEDALEVIYSENFEVEDIAGLAKVVAKAAEHDQVSRRILNNAGIALADSACAVASQLKMTDASFPIALVGGTFKAGSYVIDPFVKRVKRVCPHVQTRRLNVEPAKGAVMLALDLLNR